MARVSDTNSKAHLDYVVPRHNLQVVSISFTPTSDNKDASVPGTQTVTITLTTSDGLPTQFACSVDVNDAGTGSAVSTVDYTFVDSTKSFAAGTVTGSTATSTITILGNNQNTDIDLVLEVASGCDIGNGTYQCNLTAGGGGGEA